MRSRLFAACGIATVVASAAMAVPRAAAEDSRAPPRSAVRVRNVGAAPRLATMALGPQPAPEPTACPDAAHMALVDGDYCPEVRHECKRWLESGGAFAYYRCAEYTSATCLSKSRVHMRYCMDKDEYARPGERLPMSHASWTDAKNLCEQQGKRVCLESEWNFACEGEEMRAPTPTGGRATPTRATPTGSTSSSRTAACAISASARRTSRAA